jgi:hypothetical protein
MEFALKRYRIDPAIHSLFPAVALLRLVAPQSPDQYSQKFS